MRNKLIQYVDGLFAEAPNSARVQELHDEILQNTLDRYDEEITMGNSEEDAYRAAIGAIGDINALLRPLCQQDDRRTAFRAIAVALYVLSIVPVILGDALGDDTIGVCLMFACVAAATFLLLYPADGRLFQSRRLRAAAVALYILCVTPPIIFDEVGGRLGEALGVCLMFIIAAAATVLIVLSADRKQRAVASAAAPLAAAPQTPARPSRPLAMRIAAPIYWIAVVFLFSLCGGYVGWPRSWLVFVFAGGLWDIICGIAAYSQQKNGLRKIFSGLIGIASGIVYLALAASTGRWLICLLVFGIGGAISGIVSGWIDLVGGSK